VGLLPEDDLAEVGSCLEVVVSETDRLTDLLRGRAIPATRRDLSDPSNLRWLGRNLPIGNADHPDIDEAVALVRALSRA